MTFNYNVGGCITQITAPDGTFVSYDYKGNCNGTGSLPPLRQVMRPDGSIVQYSYNASNSLTSVTDEHGTVFASLTYNSDQRVTQERLADGGLLQFSYQLQNPTAGILSPVLSTTVTDPLGNQTVYRFNSNQGVIGFTDPFGRTRTIDRDGGNYVTGFHGTGACPVCGDPAAGDQSFVYDDATGNLVSYTDGLGKTTTFTYDPLFNKLTSIKDPLGNITSFTLDSQGNRLSRKDANGNLTSYAYDAFGERVSVTDPVNQTTSFTYDAYGNLASAKDPLGNTTFFQYDANGRLIQTKDALGRLTTFTYDGLSRITSQTNAQGKITRFAYDERGNLTGVTDTASHSTAFTYDLINRLLTRSDPIGRVDSRTYDLNGNLIQFKDRRGQTSAFAYDSANRLITETYPDAVVTRSYDANDRISQVNDSAGGVFGFTYDAAGRLLSSNTPVGAVQYVRDALGRATSRQVTGQPVLTYAYDPVGNLSSATLPGMAATFAYDARNNLANISRANGVSSSFAYDSAERLQSITHRKASTLIDEETYAYDAVGNRTGHSTSSGEALVTPAIPSASYDSANEQTQFGTIANSFDANGNLVASSGAGGTTTFTWDSRNRLKSIVAGGQTTTFTYDFAGNLIVQADTGTSSNLTRSFILDDLTNLAYESASDGTSFSVLSGRAIDSHLGISQSGGQVLYGLADGINSTMATVDQTGALQAQFAYEPFGAVTPTSAYPFQFTGRMPVGASLDYYRARFYNGQTRRFISEDPLGFAGQNTNFYSYVGNSPVNFIDPLGLAFGPPIWGPKPIPPPIGPAPLPIGGPVPKPIPVGSCQAGENPPCRLIGSEIVPHWNRRQCTYLCGSFTLYRYVGVNEKCPEPNNGWVPGSPVP